MLCSMLYNTLLLDWIERSLVHRCLLPHSIQMIKFSPEAFNQYVQEVDEPVVPVEPTPVHSEEEEQVEELILCPTKQNHFEQ